MAAFPVDCRLEAEPEGVGHLERVDDMKVVSPSLGEVLPGMGGRVGRDKALLPVRRRALAVVALQRLGVVLLIVAKFCPAGLEHAAVAHENIPIVVADLVPEMAKGRAIGLVQLRAALLAFSRVRFYQRNRHRAIVVASHDFRA